MVRQPTQHRTAGAGRFDRARCLSQFASCSKISRPKTDARATEPTNNRARRHPLQFSVSAQVSNFGRHLESGLPSDAGSGIEGRQSVDGSRRIGGCALHHLLGFETRLATLRVLDFPHEPRCTKKRKCRANGSLGTFCYSTFVIRRWRFSSWKFSVWLFAKLRFYRFFPR